MSLEQALMNVPVLREMLGLEQFDQTQQLGRVRQVQGVMDAATKLAELQSAPISNAFRQAQTNKLNYERQVLEEQDRAMRGAAEKHLRPRQVPLQGPTAPGEAPLGSVEQPPGDDEFKAYARELFLNPRTQALALDMEKQLNGNWTQVGAGGLYNSRTGERIEGAPNTTLEKLIQAQIKAAERGDLRTAEYLQKLIDKMTGPSGSGTMAGMNELTALLEKADREPLTPSELRRAEMLHEYVARGQRYTTAEGSFEQPAMNLPSVREMLARGGRPAQAPGGQTVPGQQPQPQPQPTVPGDNRFVRPANPQGTIPNKPLTPEVQKAIADRSTATKYIEALMRDFDDSFASNKIMRAVGMVTGDAPADVRMMLSRKDLGVDPAMADWWSGVLDIQAGKRHELVGATLTEGERKMFDQLALMLGDSPARIRAHLNKMLLEAKNREQGLVETHSQGFDPKGIEAARGRGNPFIFGKNSTNSKPIEVTAREADGSTRTFTTIVRKNPKTGKSEIYDKGAWHPAGE